jgi:hypothetical protein
MARGGVFLDLMPWCAIWGGYKGVRSRVKIIWGREDLYKSRIGEWKKDRNDYVSTYPQNSSLETTFKLTKYA